MRFSKNYKQIDRILHYLAFASPVVQKTLANIEDDVLKKNFASIESRNEVFITGLPRAGTTLMLELLNASGEFRSLSYRQMPFILAPLLWNRLSHPFQKNGQEQERAHGDGMLISVDSPEALDEVVWLAYLRKQFVQEDRLSPLSLDDIDTISRHGIQNYVRKVLALPQRSKNETRPLRYLSKNNANISRMELLLDLFPTSTILVIFRHPLAHISSLSTQHERFLKEHKEDPFSRKYMEWIGHYDFGANFKPIDFDGWLRGVKIPSQIDSAFWLRYWNAAYSHALKHKTKNVHFVDFDFLLKDSTNYLTKLYDTLSLENKEALLIGAKRLRSPMTKPVTTDTCPAGDWNRAQEIHAELKSVSIK